MDLKVKMEWQTVYTLIRLFIYEQPDLGLHYFLIYLFQIVEIFMGVFYYFFLMKRQEIVLEATEFFWYILLHSGPLTCIHVLFN